MQLQLLSLSVRDTLPSPVDSENGQAVPDGSDALPHTGGCFVICVCADEDGRTVCLVVQHWQPHVLVRLARRLAPHAAEDLARELQGLPPVQRNPETHAPCDHAQQVASANSPRHEQQSAMRLFGFDIDYEGRRRARRPFLRVHMRTVRELRGARRRFNQIARNKPDLGMLDIVEHKVPLESKFCDAIGVPPSGWLHVDEGACREMDSFGLRYSSCNREFLVPCAALAACPREDIAPFTLASVDIECLPGPNGAFPRAEQDPIICIGTVFGKCGFASQPKRVMFALRDCEPIADCEVLCFDSELELLQAWRDRIVREETVVLTGYNLLGFDLKYMVARHNTLVAEAHMRATGDTSPLEEDDHGWMVSRHAPSRFPMQSMLCTERSKAFAKELNSAAMGWNDHFHIDGFGRFTLDVLMYVKINYKLPRYTLDYVASKFVGDTKHDITFEDMKRYFGMDAAKRQVYCAYCVQDCMLPLELCRRLFICEDYVQTSRVQWTSLRDIVTRGQQIRVFNMLLRHAHENGFVIDREPQSSFGRTDDSSDDEGYEGATVLPPTTGYYRKAVATLDFASLYPSIMRAHNLCYTTLWPPEAGTPPEWLQVETMQGCTFVVDPTFRGVLPTMLDHLLGARKQTKREMARETDPTRKALLDKKQQAQKVSANSVYGFTGAVKQGMYACAEVARTVTAYGRDYIARTRQAVHDGWGLDVIYGDTDSVMVHMNSDDDAWVFRTAEEMGDKISAMFPAEIILEFEKVYAPYMLLAKKRYAGNKREHIDEEGKMDVKGIECARRDNAPIAGATQRAALEALIMRNDPADAVRIVANAVRGVVLGSLPFEDYVITKALRASYKNDNLAHVQAARRREERGEPAPVGGRVEYVILPGNDALYNRAEDAEYARANTCTVDREYYIQKQIMQPVQNLFHDILPLQPLFDEALQCVRDQMQNDAKRQFLQRMGLPFDQAALSKSSCERLDQAERTALDAVESIQ